MYQSNNTNKNVIVVKKDKKNCQIIDFACPYDGRVDTK